MKTSLISTLRLQGTPRFTGKLITKGAIGVPRRARERPTAIKTPQRVPALRIHPSNRPIEAHDDQRRRRCTHSQNHQQHHNDYDAARRRRASTRRHRGEPHARARHSLAGARRVHRRTGARACDVSKAFEPATHAPVPIYFDGLLLINMWIFLSSWSYDSSECLWTQTSRGFQRDGGDDATHRPPDARHGTRAEGKAPSACPSSRWSRETVARHVDALSQGGA